MWVVVNTDKFREQQTRQLLLEKFQNVVKDVYLPMYRQRNVDETGKERLRFRPLLYGFLFVKVESLAALTRCLTPWGYFMYREPTADADAPRSVFTTAHLLCKDVKEVGQNTIIERSTIPNDDMERFMYYSDRFADSIEGLEIVDVRYKDLILENDVIRILSGPLEGWTGVVKQVKKKGRKDRHLLVSFGTDHCLSISNIRKYDMCIEHEATAGDKSETVGVWRAIDQIIGSMQVRFPDANAAAALRALLKKYNVRQTLRRKSDMSDVAYARQSKDLEDKYRESVMASVDASMRGNFRILANYFHADASTVDSGLQELIPDQTLRPFLTPMSGLEIPEGKSFAVLRHNGIVELVLRVSLSGFFATGKYKADWEVPSCSDDYDYYAHVALLPTALGKVKAVTSWGGFYDRYATLSVAERKAFLDDLQAKRYVRTCELFAGGAWTFERLAVGQGGSGGFIAGFSTVLDIDFCDDDVEAMACKAAAVLVPTDAPDASSLNAQMAAAVEMWQGTRLLMWRQLLQRYVLLHKIPVADSQNSCLLSAEK